MWELSTLAQQPYGEIDPFEMAKCLGDGLRLAHPKNCPDELFAIMACCWALSPNNRPVFSHLIQGLSNFHSQLTKYV